MGKTGVYDRRNKQTISVVRKHAPVAPGYVSTFLSYFLLIVLIFVTQLRYVSCFSQ